MLRKGKRMIGICVAIIALGTVWGMPRLASAQYSAVSMEQPLCIQIEPGNEQLAADLSQANIVYDLYHVAVAQPMKGYDALTFEMLPDYAIVDLAEGMDNTDWQLAAQLAAQIALQGKTPVRTGADAREVITKTDDGDALTPGVYLLIARGKGIEEYTRTITTQEGEESLVSIAYSHDFMYTFAPELIVLPTKQVNEEGIAHTGNPGEWIYEQQITLKPSQHVRYGSLEIVKTLSAYETKDPATFVFSVEAQLDGTTVYSDVVPISFQGAGQQSVFIDKIPVGAAVTVKEIYAGYAYHLTSEDTKTAVIEAEETVSVAFSNTYDGTGKSGGAVTNHFTYEEENGWVWTQILDGSLGGAGDE